MYRVLTAFLANLFLIGSAVAEPGPLTLVESVVREDLGGTTSVVVSPDGRFLYASAYQAASHVVFARDAKTGKLEHVQTVQDEARLEGATALRLSTDGRLAVATAFRAKAVSLYTRDKDSGKLTLTDSKQLGIDEEVAGLEWATEISLSRDAKFVYALDDHGGLTIFRIAGMKDAPALEFIEHHVHADFAGVRGMAHHPSGKFAFVASRDAGAVSALRRDSMSGKVTFLDTLRDEEEGVTGLAGAFGIATDASGQFVYTVSGRFEGDDSVGVFRFDAEKGSLARIQEIVPATDPVGEKVKGADEVGSFAGGNEISLSQDGKRVYAIASESASLAAFDRDAETGKLTLIQIIVDPTALGTVSGVGVSPDGRFVYAAAETSNAVSVYSVGE